MRRIVFHFPFKSQGMNFFLFLFSISVLAGCGSDESSAPSSFFPSLAESELKEVLGAVVSRLDVFNAALVVDAPDHDFIWSGARGVANPQTNETMTSDHAFRIASVTKTFTATVVLRLAEEGVWNIESRLDELLDDSDIPGSHTVSDLHVYKGQKHGGELTIRQLLQHTTGMRDYIFDEPSVGKSSLFELYGLDLADGIANGAATRQWTPEDLLDYYLDSGLAEADFEPGLRHKYSDTNYLILGILIEKITGGTLAQAYRDYVFDPLGLEFTYLEWYEPSRGKEPVHHYFNLGSFGASNVDVIQAGMNTSLDWSGGGLVSTVGELNTFIRALLTGQILKPGSMDAMLSMTPDGMGGSYGLGMEKQVSSEGVTYLGHSGFWGVWMGYLEEENVSFAITTNQAITSGPSPLRRIMDALSDAGMY